MFTIGEVIHGTVRISLCMVLIFSLIQVAPIFSISDFASAEGPPKTDDWPMFRHDLNRTGNTSSHAPNKDNILWTNQCPTPFYTWGYCSSPAVSGGVVYQGSGENCVLAIDAETGLNVWNPPLATGRITSSPTIANDHVFFGSYDRNIYCVSLDKTVLWKTPINDYVDSSPVVYNGKVYCGSGQGDYIPSKASLLYCLDETDGSVLWTFKANGQIISSPTVVNDMVIFGSYDENVYAIPTEDPTPGDKIIDISEAIWIFDAGGRVVSSASVEDDVVYIGSIGGKLFAIPLTDPNDDGIIDTDEVVWEFVTGNEIWGSPGIANNRIFIGSHDYHLYALPKEDPNQDRVISSFEVLWKYRTTDKIWSSPTIAGGKVFIASEDYTLWAFCEDTGQCIWHYTMELQSEPFGSEYLYAQPAVVNGKIYIGNYDLTLYCFGDEDDSPPGVEGVFPSNNSLEVPLNSNIEITFNENLCDILITDSSVIVQSSSGKHSTGQVIYNSTTSKLAFNPDEDFLPKESYTVRLISKYLQDYAGNPLDGNGNGIMDTVPNDDHIFFFDTGELVGHKPKIEDAYVTPQQGYITTTFDFYATYTDEDNDAPISPAGEMKIFIDGSLAGEDMTWANNTNTPYSHLLDHDFTNGELFHFKTQLDAVGEHGFYIECSDGSNTNKTPVYFLPAVLNSPPIIGIPIQYVKEDEEFILNLSIYVNDVDNDTIQLAFKEDSDYCEIIENHLIKFCVTEDRILSETVNITVGDGINSASQYVLFIINPTNDPPTLKSNITGLPSIISNEDSVYVFDLRDYVTDSDTPLELLQVSSDSENMIPIGLNLYLFYTEPIPLDNITLTVSDGSNSLILYLEVEVMEVNQSFIPQKPQDEGDGGEDSPDSNKDDDIVMSLLGLIMAIIIALILLNVWIFSNYKEKRSKENSVESDKKSSSSTPAVKDEEPKPPKDEDAIYEDEPPPPDDEELPPPDDEPPPPLDEGMPPSEDDDIHTPENGKSPPSGEDEFFVKGRMME